MLKTLFKPKWRISQQGEENILYLVEWKFMWFFWTTVGYFNTLELAEEFLQKEIDSEKKKVIKEYH